MRTPKNWSRVSPENLARVSNLWPVQDDRFEKRMPDNSKCHNMDPSIP